MNFCWRNFVHCKYKLQGLNVLKNINNIGHPICSPHKSSSTFFQEIYKIFQAKTNKQKPNVPYHIIYIRITTSSTINFLTLKFKPLSFRDYKIKSNEYPTTKKYRRYSPQWPESPFHSIHIRLRMPTVHLTVHCLPCADCLVLLWLVLRVLVLEIHVNRLSTAILSTAVVKEPIDRLVNRDTGSQMCVYIGHDVTGCVTILKALHCVEPTPLR